jgi:type I protein arginine methyltransferase
MLRKSILLWVSAVASCGSPNDSCEESSCAAAAGRQKSVLDLAANPFGHHYSNLIHQQNMLQDSIRTAAYHDAILSNAAEFHNKVVLDVGTGSGILALFAVKAGARKVYAVEASGAAHKARALVEAAGLSDRIVVIQSKVEDIVLPPGDELVDILISEPCA